MQNFYQLMALIEDEPDIIANMANISAWLNDELDRINWVGFYLMKNNELVLGPFQGHPACTHIALGRGVCGTSAKTKTTQRVADVHQFPGHIACDSQSRSEIVIPLIKEDQIIGVLDIDSPELDRFSQSDQDNLEAIAKAIIPYIS
ncbi:MAG: GAF domain-containing protein [Erysipelotrichaceae bacterium]|nr:GAF domain-containing protein [Erysipelotrichaceae bacterium]